MKQKKIFENYFDAKIYTGEQIEESIKETKKEFAKKVVDVDISLNEFGVYVVTYYFEVKDHFWQKIMIKLKQRKKKKAMLYFQKEPEKKLKKERKSKEQKRQEKLQKRKEKYFGHQYGIYKETKTYRPYK